MVPTDFCIESKLYTFIPILVVLTILQRLRSIRKFNTRFGDWLNLKVCGIRKMKLSDIFFTNSKLVWLLHMISGHGYAYAALNTSLPIRPWPWPWWMGGANLKIAFHVARHANTNKTADKKKGSQTWVLKCAWVGASLSIITVIPHCPSCLSHVMCFSEQSHVPHVLLFLVTCGHICDIKSNSLHALFLIDT